MLAIYQTPDFLAAVHDWWAILLGVLAVVGWLIRREIKQWRDDLVEQVQQRTEPIQPEANGGKSLADVHRKLDDLARQDSLTCTRITALEQVMRDHLVAHRNDEQEGDD